MMKLRMKFIIALLVLATGCTTAVKSGTQARATVFAVEGLGYGDYVTNGLIAPLQEKYEFNFVRISWGHECPAEYPEGILLAAGHSMGGPTALDCVARSGRQWELVYIMDARANVPMPYRAPPNAKRTLNVYQKSLWMPGYPVEGAEEHQTGASHTELPYLPEVRAEFEKILKGAQ